MQPAPGTGWLGSHWSGFQIHLSLALSLQEAAVPLAIVNPIIGSKDHRLIATTPTTSNSSSILIQPFTPPQNSKPKTQHRSPSSSMLPSLLRPSLSSGLRPSIQITPHRRPSGSNRLITPSLAPQPRLSSSSSSKHPLAFPTHRSPTPFEIFHLPRSATADQIKHRYYQLVKIYHPDVASKDLRSNDPSSSSVHSQELEITQRFKLIRDAYDLLSSPSKRQNYLRHHHGWNQSRPQSPNRSWSNPTHHSVDPNQDPLSSLWLRFINRNDHYQYSSARHGFYSSSSHFSQQDPSDHSSSSFKHQWERDGLFTKNGIFITSIGGISLLLYLIQLSRVLPLVKSDDRFDLRSSSSSSSHHDHERAKFRKFIEPEGDQRLDQDAWSRIKPIQFMTIDSSGRLDLGSEPIGPLPITSLLNHNHTHSHPQPNPQRWSISTSSFRERIHQQNLKSARDLRSARAAAVKPSGFSRRISRPNHTPPTSTSSSTTTPTASLRSNPTTNSSRTS